MQEEIDQMYMAQFMAWPEVKRNYDRLLETRRKKFQLSEMPVAVQFNPGRVRSTAAKVEADDIASRPCFLCSKNRPKEQLAGAAIPDYEILINPYPILPVHFTIASKEHTPQTAMPLEMVDFVNLSPDLTAFFNGAKAGASAPDHLHFQGVRKEELPLLKIIEERHRRGDGFVKASYDLGDFPFGFLSAVVEPSLEGMQLLSLLPKLGGVGDDAETRRGLVNTFVWLDSAGVLRVLVIPRKAHRPKCFFEEGEGQLMVSPGALDMAGVMVTVRENDFDHINEEDVRRIYAETGLTADELRDYCAADRILNIFMGAGR